MAWESREPGSCVALRTHIARFPSGTYREVAASMLAARQVTRLESWAPTQRTLTLFLGQSDSGSPDGASARNAALRRAQREAERLCRGFAATTTFRLRAAAPVVHMWDCSETARGVQCFDGEAVCELDEKRVEEHETCGLAQ